MVIYHSVTGLTGRKAFLDALLRPSAMDVAVIRRKSQAASPPAPHLSLPEHHAPSKLASSKAISLLHLEPRSRTAMVGLGRFSQRQSRVSNSKHGRHTKRTMTIANRFKIISSANLTPVKRSTCCSPPPNHSAPCNTFLV